jgi:polar amino acid transport system ATP-binding protein
MDRIDVAKQAKHVRQGPVDIGQRGDLYVNGHLIGYRQDGDRLYELRPREVAAQRRDICMVFQHFNLFPHMTALANVTEAPCAVPESRAWP